MLPPFPQPLLLRVWWKNMRFGPLVAVAIMIVLLALPGAVMAGNTATASGSIAQPAPVAAFTASPLTNSWVIGVAPVTVTFTDQSTVTIGTIDTWKWEYNAGAGWVQFSTVKNPVYIFNTPGAYDIRLTVSNTGGSSTATKTHFVEAGYTSDPLKTVSSGTVSGDLYMQSYSPFTTEDTETFTLPAAATGSNVQWARVYVSDYSGSGANNWFVNLETDLNGNVLGNEICDLQAETNSHAYPLNDHVMKVYSDYGAWYDVTGLITTTTPSIHVKATAVTNPAGSMGFDGRIKGITLVVAYNDGSSNQVKYVVNQGNDWMTGSSSTTFDATSFAAGWTQATVRSVAHSSTDGTYTFNTVSPTKTTLLSGSYIKWDSFDVGSLLTSGSNTFAYTNAGSSLKMTIAALTARYPVPVAAFTWTPTSPDRGTSVSFDASSSTGSITSYAWDFGDGNAGSGKTASHTYTTSGDKSVKLTVTGPSGSNSVTNTVHVKELAPIVDFTPTSASGPAPLTVNFQATNTGGQVNTWDWNFGDGTAHGSGQSVSHTYTTAGTYSVILTATGPDYTATGEKDNIIQVGTATITVSVAPTTIPLGTMSTAAPSTGSTQVAVATSGGTGWSVTASATNGGFMTTGSNQLASAFQLANGGGSFSPLTSPVGFMTGAPGESRTDTANVKQVIGSGDQPGSYSITLTFTGAFV